METAVLFPSLFLLGVAVLALGVVYLVMKARSNEPIVITFRLVASGYFYLMSIVSLLVLLVGLSSVVKAGLSDVLGRDFSYVAPVAPAVRMAPLPASTPVPPGTEAKPVPSAPSEEQVEQARRQQERNYRDSLIQGISMAVVGGVVWVLHLAGRRRMGLEEAEPFFKKAYLALLLGIFSVVGIIFLPTAVYETLRYYILGPVNEFGYRPAPGGSLANAIVFVPFWVYYLLALLRETRHNGAARA